MASSSRGQATTMAAAGKGATAQVSRGGSRSGSSSGGDRDGRKKAAAVAAAVPASARAAGRNGVAAVGRKEELPSKKYVSDSDDDEDEIEDSEGEEEGNGGGDDDDEDRDNETDSDDETEDEEDEEDQPEFSGYLNVKGLGRGEVSSSTTSKFTSKTLSTTRKSTTSTTSTTAKTKTKTTARSVASTASTTVTAASSSSGSRKIIIDSPGEDDELTEDEDHNALGGGGGGGAGGHEVDSTDDDSDDAWATESFYEDALGNANEEAQFESHENACTQEQMDYYRKRLRDVGPAVFLQETVHTRTISAKKLITAFGCRPPAFLEGAPDVAFLPILQVAIGRELRKRRKLKHINTLDDVSRLLKKSKNIIVLTGAGISTSLGIPDFRSKDNGLYSRLAGLGLSDPQEVFDIDVFQDDPTIFYSIAKDILPTTDTFSPTHAFIELLQRKNKLLTQYTQNIDNLETRAGIRPEKLIQCHGSFATASCVKCKYKVEGEKIFPELRAGRVAKCERCLGKVGGGANGGKKRKRGGKGGRGDGRESMGSNGVIGRKQKYSEDSSADEEECKFQEAGVMKPDITFFGEQLPDAFHDRLVEHDHQKCDLLICIGTSLKVAPVSEIIGFLPPDVPQIYISKTPVTHVEFDVELLGSCDDVVVELCRRVGWELKHEMIPEGLVVKVEEGGGEGNEDEHGRRAGLAGRYVFTRE